MADVLSVKQDVKFHSIAKFKEDQGISKIEILRNPKTNKLFAVADEELTFRVAGNFDPAKEAVVGLFPNEQGGVDWCVLNRGTGAPVIATL